MKRRLPKLTVIWLYDGIDREDRHAFISALDYPAFTVISTDGSEPLARLASGVPADCEICAFWADDGKPVSPNFLREMVHPLNGDDTTDMHLWSGNALTMRSQSFHEVGNIDFVFKKGTFMKMALLFLDTSYSLHGRRARVTFSTTERLAPMCAEPVGLPS